MQRTRRLKMGRTLCWELQPFFDKCLLGHGLLKVAYYHYSTFFIFGLNSFPHQEFSSYRSVLKDEVIL